MQFEELDKKIKEAADQHHPAYDEKAWQKMERLLNEHLPQPKNDRRRIIFLLLFLLLAGGGSFLLIAKPWNKKPVIADQLVKQDKNQVQSNKEGTKKNEAGSNQQAAKEINNKEATDKNTSSNQQDDQIIANTIEKKNEKQFSNSQKNKITGQSQFVKTQKEINKTREEINYKDNIASPVIQKSIYDPNSDKNDITVVGNDKEKQKSGKIEIIRPGKEEKEDAIKTNKENVANEEEKNQGNKNTSQEIKAEPKKSSKKTLTTKNGNGFSFSISAGPDVSKAGSSKSGKTTLIYGAGIGYTRDRLTLRTGIYASKKIYWAGPDDYKLSYSPSPAVKFEGADANCDVIEIPVKLSYTFGLTNRSNWFAGAGLSSYLMKREKYIYTFKTATGTYPHLYEVKNENKHYFSVLSLSGGYTRQLNHILSISAEPYVEIPVTGIGAGKVHLNSGGILFTIRVKPFRR